MNIVELTANQPPERFYRGGARIAQLRGTGHAAEREPEDWVASTTTVAGEAPVGISALPGGQSLPDAIAADPKGWLGEEHLTTYGPDTMLLVKILDAGERLPVHAHPSREFAAAELGAAHGKTESWYIIEPGSAHIGFNRDIERDELDAIVREQDKDALLAAMNLVTLNAGDVLHVPAGFFHAIGAGILLVELQEPEDLSIFGEWSGYAFDGEANGHCGIGFEAALAAVDRRAVADVEALVHRADSETPLIPAQAEKFYRLERVTGDATVAPGFAVLVVLDGESSVHTDAEVRTVGRGFTGVVPHAAGSMRFEGNAEILICRPPVP